LIFKSVVIRVIRGRFRKESSLTVSSVLMDIAAYLARIGYTGPIVPTAETLRDLQRAHLYSVPFENLDIGRKRQIVVDPENSIRKIVNQRRGGFCYELNGAFAALLEALGFRVTLLSARVPCADGSDGPEFDHLCLRVDLEQPWLADVGFGDSFLEPLLLKPGLEQQQQDGRVFRMVELERQDALDLQRKQADGWKREYLFSLQPRRIEEFAAMCHYHQTSPESPFTRKRVCSLATPDGRITLADTKLIITRNGVREERPVASEEEWNQLLRAHFGTVLA
jgi:N-hydroxyarylamine O-acetyltransferase